MKLLFLITFILPTLCEVNVIKTIKSEEAEKFINDKSFVLALFCRSSATKKCQDFETEISNVKEDLIEVMDGGVDILKLVDSSLLTEYIVDPISEVLLIFFRNGVPVLYDGPAQDEYLIDSLVRFKERGIQELTDSSFEHLTQAATGATTGDWFVLFSSSKCRLCKRMTAALETVACNNRGRSNVARVDIETTGLKTGERFEINISEKPVLILFRLGRMYRYGLEKYDTESLSSFVTGFYKNYPAEAIPLPRTPFDELVSLCVEYLKIYPYLFLPGVGMLFGLLLLLFYTLSKEEKKEEEDKKED